MIEIPTEAIVAACSDIDANRRLPASLVSTLIDAGLFGLYARIEHGGHELAT
jgi:hypothetical protein